MDGIEPAVGGSRLMWRGGRASSSSLYIRLAYRERVKVATKKPTWSGLRKTMLAFLLMVILTSQVPALGTEQPSVYILVTERKPSSADLRQILETGASIKFTYDYLPGVAVSATQSQIDRISSLGFVRGVFPDTLRRLSIVGAEILTHVEGRQDFDHTYNLDLIDAEPSDVKATGKGVIVAVLDTGLIFEWREFLREESVLSEFGRAFVGAQGTDNENKWQHDTNSHGLAVAATIVGFKLDDKSEEGGFLSEPLTGDPEARVFVRGVAPDAKIIPVKVCEDAGFCFLSSVIKGIDYVIGLVASNKVSGRVVINLSLGGPSPSIPESSSSTSP